MPNDSNGDIAHLIDHTILSASATEADIERYCSEAIAHGFCSVVVNPVRVRLAKSRLVGSLVRTVSVAGFPLGATSTALKMIEAEKALNHGADEIDVVVDLGAMADGRYRDVEAELMALRKVTTGKVLKVIIEASLLSGGDKATAARISADVGADYVKTSTGFSSGGATVQDVELIRKVVGSEVGVKASGGIHTRETALKMIDAGATRIGSSVGIALLQSPLG